MPNEDGFEPGQFVTFEEIMAARQKVYAGSLPTREEIATMKKADVVDWLKAHGVDDPTGSIAKLREKLTAIMYMEA